MAGETQHECVGADAGAGAPYVVVDVESTGFRVTRDRVYEVSILTVQPSLEVTEHYETLIRPSDCKLSPRTAAAVGNAPTFAEVAGDVVARLRLGPVVGHNASFDLSMIDAELQRLGCGLPAVEYLCTLELASKLAIDAPSRRLAVLCHVLGVEMPSWHTARGDAEATRRLLLCLLDIAASRGVLGQTTSPSLFHGAADQWPSLPATNHRVLPRDPATFPPSGETPQGVNTVEAWKEYGSQRASVAIDRGSLIDHDMVALAIVRRTLSAHADRTEWPEEVRHLAQLVEDDDIRVAAPAARKLYDILVPDLASAAREDWQRGQFAGESGIQRLREIAAWFEEADDDELWEVKYRFATMLRYEPGHGKGEVTAAYRDAYQAAVALDAEVENKDGGCAEDVLYDWLAYLVAERDINGITELVALSADLSWFNPASSISQLAAQLASQGETALVIQATEQLTDALAAIGETTAAADVYEMWARALTKQNDTKTAIEVCEQCWKKGWRSRNLANRYSLALEREKRWPEAVAICDSGLQDTRGDVQITRRRERCLTRMSR